MSIDQDKWIGAQHIMGKLIESLTEEKVNLNSIQWTESIENGFDTCFKLMEKYATVGQEDEWISTGISIPREFWNGNNETKKKWLTEYGRTQKDDQGFWYVFVRRKDLDKFKKEIAKKETELGEKI